MPAMVVRLHQGPHHHRDHRVQPHRLLEHGVQPGVAVGVAGVGGRRVRRISSGCAAELVQRPRQRGRGGLVAGEQQRDQLVAQLGVGEPVAGLRRPRGSAGTARRCARRGRRPYAARGSRRTSARRARPGSRRPRHGPNRCSAGSAQPSSTAGLTLTVALTRGRSAASRFSSVTPKTTRRITSSVSTFIRSWERNGWPSGQCATSSRREVGDQLLVAAQRVAVERRHQQLAGPLVLGAVLEQQRVLAHDRAEDRVALAGVEDLGVAREDLLRVLGPGEEDQRPALRHQPHRVDVAVLLVQVRVEPVPEPQQRDGLHERRPGRSRRAARRCRPPGSLSPPASVIRSNRCWVSARDVGRLVIEEWPRSEVTETSCPAASDCGRRWAAVSDAVCASRLDHPRDATRRQVGAGAGSAPGGRRPARTSRCRARRRSGRTGSAGPRRGRPTAALAAALRRRAAVEVGDLHEQRAAHVLGVPGRAVAAELEADRGVDLVAPGRARRSRGRPRSGRAG